MYGSWFEADRSPPRTANMLVASNLRRLRPIRRLAAAPKWDPRSSELSISARRAIATSPQPAREEKRWSTFIEKWWLLIPAGLFGSSAWNFFRERGKGKVRNYRKSKLKLEALKGNEIYNVCFTESLDSMEFREVVCKGVYDEKNSILVHKYIRIKSGNWINGYNIITPLIPIPGDSQSIQSPILVNRGWVPLSWGNKASELESNSSSSPPSSTLGREVQLVGVISKGERPNKLWRSNNPAKSEWFKVDVPSLARACGLPETTLHVVEIDPSSKMDTRKPFPLPFLKCEVKEIYLSQLEHGRYSSLGFFNGCAAMAAGLKKFGKV